MSSSCHHSLVTDDGQLAGCGKSFQISVDTELQRRPVDARHKSLSSGRAQARTRGPCITISFEFNNLRMAGILLGWHSSFFRILLELS
jgi:hypothetical protein